MTDILRTGILLLIALTSTADSLAIPAAGSNRQSKATNLEESMALQPLAAPPPPLSTAALPQTSALPSASVREQSGIAEQSTASSPSLAASLRRSSYDAPVDEHSAATASVLTGESDLHRPKTHSNVFFGSAALRKQAKSMLPPLQLGGGATFENIAPNYIGPNYLMSSGGPVNRNSHEDGSTLSGGDSLSGLTFPLGNSQQQQQQGGNPLSSYYQNLFANAAAHLPGNKGSNKPSEDSINDVFNNAFKKYNVKKYLLQKILGTTHEMDEDDGGFFSNKHLKRHGTAGMAAKVIGELIGIKIRESIEGFGKSFSEYAKDFTARNFVNLGHVFSRVLKYHR